MEKLEEHEDNKNKNFENKNLFLSYLNVESE